MANQDFNSMDISKSYIPFLTAVSLVAFVAWGTFVVTKAQLTTDQKFIQVAALIADLTNSTKDLSDVIKARTQDRWTWLDQARWCAEQRPKYPDLICPVPSQAQLRQSEDNAEELEALRRKFNQLETKAKQKIRDLDKGGIGGN